MFKQPKLRVSHNNCLIPIRRHFSNITPYYYCSLPRLADTIDICFYKLRSDFSKLREQDVKDIKKRGTYTLSPFQLNFFTRKDKLIMAQKFYHILHGYDPNILMGVSPRNDGDSLVLTALGSMINQNLVNENLFMDKSFGLNTFKSEYYRTVCARRKVKRVYKLDFTNTLFIMNREILLSKLSKIVKDDPIIDFLDQVSIRRVLLHSWLPLSCV